MVLLLGQQIRSDFFELIGELSQEFVGVIDIELGGGEPMRIQQGIRCGFVGDRAGLLLGQWPSRRAWLGLLLAMAGLLWLIGRGDWAVLGGLSFAQGDLLMLLATLDWALLETLLAMDIVPVAAAELVLFREVAVEPAVPASVIDLSCSATLEA